MTSSLTAQTSRLNRDVWTQTSVFNRDVSSVCHACTVTFERGALLSFCPSATHHRQGAAMPGPTTLSLDAEAAWQALGGTLAGLSEAGCSTPCQVDPEPFTSDSPAERREAAAACVTACPALSACARFADAQGEVHHVWAGEDRTPRVTRKTAETGVAA